MKATALQRLHNQHLLGAHSDSVVDLLQSLGAVQAQEYLPSLWGLGIRLAPDVTRQTIVSALEDAKIVRTWLMRGTIHYAAAQDVPWMTDLLAKRINIKYRRYYEKVGLDTSTFLQGKEILLRTLHGRKRLTRRELYAAFEEAGISEPSKKGRGSFILQYWTQEGLICFGPYREKQQTFVLVSEWINAPVQLSAEEALATCTLRYFTSHGPATPQDFSWWSGLTAAEVARGIALCGAQLVPTVQNGKTYWSGAASVPADAPARPSLLLLPCFDEYTVGYKDRSAAFDPSQSIELGYGVNYNVILLDGRIIGTWKPQKDGVDIQILPGVSIAAYDEAIRTEIRRYQTYMS